tara:strand:- start:104 stop:223 length:120 start_codon:yes stop_codon:yes gene_type:complete
MLLAAGALLLASWITESKGAVSTRAYDISDSHLLAGEIS